MVRQAWRVARKRNQLGYGVHGCSPELSAVLKRSWVFYCTTLGGWNLLEITGGADFFGSWNEFVVHGLSVFN